MRKGIAMFWILFVWGILFVALCIYTITAGDTTTVVYRYTGNDTKSMSVDNCNNVYMLSDEYVELQDVESLECVWFPADMMPGNLPEGQMIKIKTLYSYSSPHGRIVEVTPMKEGGEK